MVTVKFIDWPGSSTGTPHVRVPPALPTAGTAEQLPPVGGVCERGALKEEGPVLGQHNEPFYKEFLGLAEGEIETLRREGVI